MPFKERSIGAKGAKIPERREAESTEEVELTREEELSPEEKDERNWIKENFSELIEMVEKRYESPESTLADDERERKTYNAHNKDILRLCVERGLQKGISKTELRMLYFAAIFHDLTKGDKPPSDRKDIQNYVLAVHGEAGAKEAKDFLEDEKNSEILAKILEREKEEEKKVKYTPASAIKIVESAIRSHMGPHPGFMTGILEKVNKELHERGEKEIKHPYPEKGNIVAETLLAADMRSLASRKGIEKVMAIRSNPENPWFKKEDKKLCQQYKGYNIRLTPGEAALLSAFDSAEQARDMLKDGGDQDWVNEVIEVSKVGGYLYGEEGKLKTVTYESVIRKRWEFEEKIRTEKEKKGIVD